MLLQSSDGQLILVRPDAAGYSEITRFSALGGDNYNSPAVCDGRIYARSTTEGVCLEVAAPLPAITGTTIQTGGHVRIQFTGGTGTPYEVFCTTNLTVPNWTSVPGLQETPAGSGNYSLVDSNAAALPAKFYKTR